MKAEKRDNGDLIYELQGQVPHPVPVCIECKTEPAIDGGRCLTCRGKSML